MAAKSSVVTEERNILIVGSGGAGKSTFANQLAGQNTFPVKNYGIGTTLPIEERVIEMISSSRRKQFDPAARCSMQNAYDPSSSNMIEVPIDDDMYKQPWQHSPSLGGQQQTRGKVYEFYHSSEVKYKIRLLDTRGLRENPNDAELASHSKRTKSGKLEISDKITLEILEAIESHILSNALNIHLVIFLLRHTPRIDALKHDFRVFQIFFEKLSDDVKKISTLVLTHCDQLTPDSEATRELALDTLIRKPIESQFVASFMRNNPSLLAVGFPSNIDARNETQQTRYRNDVETIIELIENAKEPVYYKKVMRPVEQKGYCSIM